MDGPISPLTNADKALGIFDLGAIGGAMARNGFDRDDFHDSIIQDMMDTNPDVRHRARVFFTKLTEKSAVLGGHVIKSKEHREVTDGAGNILTVIAQSTTLVRRISAAGTSAAAATTNAHRTLPPSSPSPQPALPPTFLPPPTPESLPVSHTPHPDHSSAPDPIYTAPSGTVGASPSHRNGSPNDSAACGQTDRGVGSGNAAEAGRSGHHGPVDLGPDPMVQGQPSRTGETGAGGVD